MIRTLIRKVALVLVVGLIPLIAACGDDDACAEAEALCGTGQFEGVECSGITLAVAECIVSVGSCDPEATRGCN